MALFGGFNNFWGMQPWTSYAPRAPVNMQGPMGWGRQHQSLTPYQPSGMYPYASPFGFSSPFMSYGTGMSYLMPTGDKPSGIMAPHAGIQSSPTPQSSPPYGSYPGMLPGFGFKPPGAPYDVTQDTGEVVSNKPEPPAPPAVAPAAAPQQMRYSPQVGMMLPVDNYGRVVMEKGAIPGISDTRQIANIMRAMNAGNLWTTAG